MASESHGQGAAQQTTTFELPSFLDFMGLDLHHEYLGITLHAWVPVIMSFLVGVLLVAGSLWCTRRMEKIPRGGQAFLEIVVEALYNFLRDILGENTSRYLPFLGSIFLYIILMNFWGLIPLMHSPTNSINTTLALALIVFVVYNVEGIRKKGILAYLKHFADPLFLAPIMIPIHVVGELFRPVSLSLRLFGNLTGEDYTLAVLVMLTPFLFGWIPLPFHVLMVFLALLFSAIQAVVFTMLSTIYLSLALEDEHH